MCVPALIPREHELFLTITRQVFWLIPIACLEGPSHQRTRLAVTELRISASDIVDGENTAAGSAQESHLCSLFSHQRSGYS